MKSIKPMFLYDESLNTRFDPVFSKTIIPILVIGNLQYK